MAEAAEELEADDGADADDEVDASIGDDGTVQTNTTATHATSPRTTRMRPTLTPRPSRRTDRSTVLIDVQWYKTSQNHSIGEHRSTSWALDWRAGRASRGRMIPCPATR